MIYFVYAAKKEENGSSYRKSKNVYGYSLFRIGFDIQLNDYIYAYKHTSSPTHLLMSKIYILLYPKSLRGEGEKLVSLCFRDSMNLYITYSEDDRYVRICQR